MPPATVPVAKRKALGVLRLRRQTTTLVSLPAESHRPPVQTLRSGCIGGSMEFLDDPDEMSLERVLHLPMT